MATLYTTLNNPRNDGPTPIAAEKMEETPFISIVVPCLNEKRHIAICLQSIVDQNYPRDKFEVIVVDGMSTDGTREIIDDFASRYPNLVKLDNPKRTTPAALNIGIHAAKADLISRIDAHASVDPDYLKSCVKTMRRTNAECVGGRMETKGIGFWGKFIAQVLSSIFGVGLSFRTYTNYQGYVDTVAFGLYKREALVNAGLFKEKMTRNQDWDLSRQITEAGGGIYFDPTIRSTYYCESSLLKFLKKSFINGYWVASMPDRMALRHLAPSFLIGVLAFAIYLSLRRHGSLPYEYFPLIILMTGYYLLAAFYSLRSVVENGFHSLIFVPFLFISLHLSYGLGTLYGLVTGLWLRKARE